MRTGGADAAPVSLDSARRIELPDPASRLAGLLRTAPSIEDHGPKKVRLPRHRRIRKVPHAPGQQLVRPLEIGPSPVDEPATFLVILPPAPGHVAHPLRLL